MSMMQSSYDLEKYFNEFVFYWKLKNKVLSSVVACSKLYQLELKFPLLWTVSAVYWQTIQVTSIQITDPYFYNINIQDLCTRWFLQTTIIVICIKFFALIQFKCWMLEYAYTNMWYLLWSLTIHLSLDKFIDAFIYGCLWCSDAWQTVCIEKGTK